MARLYKYAQRSPEEIKQLVDKYYAKQRKKGKPQSNMTPMQRLFLGSTGLGMMRGNLSGLYGMTTGRGNYWHGAPTESLFENQLGKGILNEGLDLRYAGINNRLNSVLMKNSPYSLVEDLVKKVHNRNLTPGEEGFLHNLIADLSNNGTHEGAFGALMNNPDTLQEFMTRMAKEKGIDIAGPEMNMMFEQMKKELQNAKYSNAMVDGKFKSLAEKVMDTSPIISKTLGIDENVVRQHFHENLPSLGKRIYFGTNPQGIAYWASQDNETGHILKNLGRKAEESIDLGKFLKQTGIGMVDQTTGGYYGDYLASKAYGSPHVTKNFNSLEELSQYLKGKQDLHNYKTLMEYSVPTRTLDSMKDMPVVRRLVQSSPFFKDMMKTFLPQADPSKDLSISENVAAKRMQQMHLVDKATGKVHERLVLNNAEKAPMQFLGGSGNRLRTLGRMAVPGAIAGAGGYMLYKAVAPAVNKLQQKIDEHRGIQKAAAVDKSLIAKMIALPAAGGLALGGLGAMGDKALQKENLPKLPNEVMDKLTPEEIEAYSNRSSAEQMKSLISTQAGGLGATAGLTALDKSPLRWQSGVAGAGLSSIAGDVARQGSLLQTDPDAVIPFLSKVPKAEEFAKKHPYLVSGAMSGAMLGAVPAAAYYTTKKYYPYFARNIKENTIDLADELFGVRNPEEYKSRALELRDEKLREYVNSPQKGLNKDIAEKQKYTQDDLDFHRSNLEREKRYMTKEKLEALNNPEVGPGHRLYDSYTKRQIDEIAKHEAKLALLSNKSSPEYQKLVKDLVEQEKASLIGAYPTERLGGPEQFATALKKLKEYSTFSSGIKRNMIFPTVQSLGLLGMGAIGLGMGAAGNRALAAYRRNKLEQEKNNKQARR